MYIKHVKPMKRAHNKKRSVYRGEKFVRKKALILPHCCSFCSFCCLQGAQFLILSYFNGKIAL